MKFIYYWRFVAVGLMLGFYLLGSGCRSYQKATINWESVTADLSGAATNIICMTRADARTCALALNSDINVVRLRQLASQQAVYAVGWWDDPAFNLDALRILRSGLHPWIIASGLSLTLPLNGALGIEKLAARAYERADVFAIKLRERALLTQVDEAWGQAWACEQRVAVVYKYYTRLELLEKRGDSLVAAGELAQDAQAPVAQESLNARLLHEQLVFEAKACRKRLLRLMGLYPTAQINFDFSAPASLEPLLLPDEVKLIEHPRLQEKMARLEVSEETLRAELRRQYPELALGPALGHEEGGVRLGLSLGVTLPLWNRNRRAIAKAEGERDIARHETLAEWRALVAELNEARMALLSAEQSARFISEQSLPVALAALSQNERLFRLGESDVVTMMQTEKTLYETQNSALEAQLLVDQARSRAECLIVE